MKKMDGRKHYLAWPLLTALDIFLDFKSYLFAQFSHVFRLLLISVFIFHACLFSLFILVVYNIESFKVDMDVKITKREHACTCISFILWYTTDLIIRIYFNR